jgi:protein-S-isoprenylcysteine O-methyltransferase Ste14
MLALYALCVIGVVATYYYLQPQLSLPSVVFGAVCLFFGCLIRRAAISAMAADWSVYTVAEQISRVVAEGPFKYSRHPYYWASILELLGISVLLSSLFGVFFSLIVYFPALVCRSFLEEKNLSSKFQKEYADYKRKTAFFVRVK